MRQKLRRRRRISLAAAVAWWPSTIRPVVCLFAFALVCPAVALGAYTPSTLVSSTGTLEADDAYSPAISEDGRYVAFTGSFDGVSGVYRKDLQTGELALVAGADAEAPALSAPDAGAPSISPEGRYVSFTTTAALDPALDTGGGCSNVYVRDMDVAIGQPEAFKLASALNGTTEGITYGGTSAGGSCPGGGSAAADRVALSLGRYGLEVAFTVIGESNLTSGPGGPVDAPPAQVAVRNLETDTTTLVSQTMSSLGSATPEAVPGGAAITSLYEAARGEGRQLSGSTAAISADGSTVAWMGIDVPEQAPASSADAPHAYPDEYAEPLWRQIANGPDAPTRRVTGGDDPACGCQGPFVTSFDPNASAGSPGPLYGTYVAPGSFLADPLIDGAASLDAVTPQLSADGQMVAILSTQPRTGEVSRGLEEELTTSTANAFVVNMAAGLSRAQALTQITRWVGDNFKNAAGTGPVESIAISPDGTRVAFATSRIDFIGPPTLVTPTLGQAGQPQLYVANLALGTIALVSYGYDGEPANGAIADPSFAQSGETLAFASSATNLVYGAFNHGSGQPGNVFVVSEVSTPLTAGLQMVGPLPSSPTVSLRRELLASTRPGPDESVLLYVTVPEAGTLRASARSEVPTTFSDTNAERRAKAAGGGATAARPSRRTRLVSRVVARAHATAKGATLVELQLKSASSYRSLVESHDGLYANITLTFAAPGAKTITNTVQATFHGKLAKRKEAKKVKRP